MAELIRLLADGLMAPIVLIALFALGRYVPATQRLRAGSSLVVAGLITFALAKFLAAVWQPGARRPFEELGLAPGAAFLPNPGFPSDHALFAMFLTLAVLFVAKKPTIAAVLFGLTLLVALGRVLALVHTPLDVIAGIVVACVGASWYVGQDRAYAKSIFRTFRKNVVQ